MYNSRLKRILTKCIPRNKLSFMINFLVWLEFYHNIKRFKPKLVKDLNYLVLADLETLNSPGNKRIYFIKMFIYL